MDKDREKRSVERGEREERESGGLGKSDIKTVVFRGKTVREERK